nr:protein 1a,pathogenesis related [Nicotiana sp.]
ENSQQDYLDAHNTARADVGVEPLTWDSQVAAYAQNYAPSLMWVDEKQYYDHDSNTCAQGQVCGHYTQVVDPPGNWRGESPY